MNSLSILLAVVFLFLSTIIVKISAKRAGLQPLENYDDDENTIVRTLYNQPERIKEVPLLTPEDFARDIHTKFFSTLVSSKSVDQAFNSVESHPDFSHFSQVVSSGEPADDLHLLGEHIRYARFDREVASGTGEYTKGDYLSKSYTRAYKKPSLVTYIVTAIVSSIIGYTIPLIASSIHLNLIARVLMIIALSIFSLASIEISLVDIEVMYVDSPVFYASSGITLGLVILLEILNHSVIYLVVALLMLLFPGFLYLFSKVYTRVRQRPSIGRADIEFMIPALVLLGVINFYSVVPALMIAFGIPVIIRVLKISSTIITKGIKQVKPHANPMAPYILFVWWIGWIVSVVHL